MVRFAPFCFFFEFWPDSAVSGLSRSDSCRVGASQGGHVVGCGLTWHGLVVSGVPATSPCPVESDSGAALSEPRRCILVDMTQKQNFSCNFRCLEGTHNQKNWN